MNIRLESQAHRFRKFRGDPELGICVVFNLVGGKKLNAHGKYKDHFKIAVTELPDRLINIQKANIDPDVTKQVIIDFLMLTAAPEVPSPNPEKFEKKQFTQAELLRAQTDLRKRLEDLSINIDS